MSFEKLILKSHPLNFEQFASTLMCKKKLFPSTSELLIFQTNNTEK